MILSYPNITAATNKILSETGVEGPYLFIWQ